MTTKQPTKQPKISAALLEQLQWYWSDSDPMTSKKSSQKRRWLGTTCYRQSVDCIFLIRLTFHSPAIFDHLIASKNLKGCIVRVENAGCQVQPKLATTSGPPASSGQTWITASSGQIWTKGSVAASEQRCSRVLASHGQPRVPQDEASAEDGRHEVSSFTVRGLERIDQHCTPHRAARRAFQPRYVVLDNVSTHVAVVMVVTEAHMDCSTIMKRRLRVMIPEFPRTVAAD